MKCGNQTIRPQKIETGELVCPACFANIAEADPFKKKCPKGSHWDPDIHQCVKDRVEAPNILESEGAKGLLKKVDYTKTLEYIKGDRGKVKEQIPAQPVVPVGPITIEQKVAALNDEIAKIQKQLAFIFGVIGQRPME